MRATVTTAHVGETGQLTHTHGVYTLPSNILVSSQSSLISLKFIVELAAALPIDLSAAAYTTNTRSTAAFRLLATAR